MTNLRHSVKVRGPPWQEIKSVISCSWKAGAARDWAQDPGRRVTELQRKSDCPPECEDPQLWGEALTFQPGPSGLHNWPALPTQGLTVPRCLQMTQRTVPDKVSTRVLPDFLSRPPDRKLGSSDTIMPPGQCWASRNGAEPGRSCSVQLHWQVPGARVWDWIQGQ